MCLKKLFYTIVLATLIFSDVSAQTPQMNLQKYWKYRERLKNFVVPGNCQGCSMISKSRATNGTISVNNYPDQTSRMGYYIGMLAMEYKLLENEGDYVHLAITQRDLYYALDAINRLDMFAEHWWDITHTTSTNDIQGFFIRDDVSINIPLVPGASPFLGQVNNSVKNEDYLNASLFPLPDLTYAERAQGTSYAYRVQDVKSAFQDGSAPTEESEDQAIHLMVGLALISKLIPYNDSYNNTAFTDPPSNATTTSYVEEARRIASRITQYMANCDEPLDGWIIENPDFDDCVEGICGVRDCSILSCGGANVHNFAWGVERAACAINNSFTSTCDNNPTQVLTSDDIMLHSQLYWGATWDFNHTVNQPDNMTMQLTISTVGGIWDWSTIGNRAGPRHLEILPLLNQLLWGDSHNTFPLTFYECLLNSAPCAGTTAHTGDPEWDAGDREWTGMGGGPPASDEFNGVDYMYIFNMYNLVNASYLGSSYKYIDPTLLCETDLTKEGYTEMDTKNFYASNSVTSGDDPNAVPYIIQNDPNLSDPQPATPANVTFAAGHYINLKPGFQATPGSLFNAFINPAIQPMNCTDIGNSCTNCSTGDEEQISNTNNYGAYKVYQCVSGEVFVATPHYLFRINGDGGTGTNMLDLQNSYSPLGNYLIGYQHFSYATITDIAYFNGYTFVGLSDGNLLKITGTGGTGNNMFGIVENGFHNAITQGVSSYLFGDEVFDNGVTRILPVNGSLLVAEGSKLLKTDGGGSGSNMFAINENSNSFSSLSCCSYYQGDAGFYGNITSMENFSSDIVFIGLDNGQVLEAHSSGTGHNMFAVNDNGTSMSSLGGYPYYIGDQYFAYWGEYPLDFYYCSGNLFIAISDGRLLKENGLAGTGNNMFAINDDGTNFSAVSGYPEFSGYQQFSGLVTSAWYDPNLNNTLIAFDNGRLLKISGSGGSGNFFTNTYETGRGFGSPQNTCCTQYFIGCMDFNVPISQITSIDDITWIGLNNGLMLKLDGEGGTGMNMYALANQAVQNLCTSYYLIGSEQFDNYGAHSPIKPNKNNSGSTASDSTHNQSNLSYIIGPNPNNGIFKISHKELASLTTDNTEYSVEITDLLGNIVYEKKQVTDNHLNINLSSYSSGTYLVRIMSSNNQIFEKKVVIIK